MFEQRKLDDVLHRMYLQSKRNATLDGMTLVGDGDPLSHWLGWFAVTEEEMMQLWQPPKEPARSLMLMIAAMQGLRDASEYLTLPGYLQMWCDGQKWDWFRDSDQFVFQFGALQRQKEEMPDGRIRSFFMVGRGMVREVVRERRPKERHIKPSPHQQQKREQYVQRVTANDVERGISFMKRIQDSEKEGSN